MTSLQDKSLFFIAIVPTGEVAIRVMELKNHMAEVYNCKAPLRSPPHITLYMPFKWKNDNEIKLSQKVEFFAGKQEPFNITLNGFGSFPPKVIFIKVEESKPLQLLKQEFDLFLRRELNLMDGNYQNKGFKPHMTIAFRDLRKSQYRTAWENFRHQTFNADFRCDNICLLKHNGKSWDIFKTLTFGA